MRTRVVDGERMTFREGAGAAWLPLPADATAEAPDVEGGGAIPEPVVTLPVDLPTLLRELEDAYIRAALAQTHSNKKEAAKLLGLGRTTLVEKLRRRNMVSARQRA
jgi:DNA-binding NtrC family response regulator